MSAASLETQEDPSPSGGGELASIPARTAAAHAVIVTDANMTSEGCVFAPQNSQQLWPFDLLFLRCRGRRLLSSLTMTYDTDEGSQKPNKPFVCLWKLLPSFLSHIPIPQRPCSSLHSAIVSACSRFLTRVPLAGVTSSCLFLTFSLGETSCGCWTSAL